MESTRYSEILDQVELVQGITQEAVFGVQISLYDDMFQVLITSLKSISEIMDHSFKSHIWQK